MQDNTLPSISCAMRFTVASDEGAFITGQLVNSFSLIAAIARSFGIVDLANTSLAYMSRLIDFS